jgi:hypothetical protein
MAEYYSLRSPPSPSKQLNRISPAATSDGPALSEFDKLRETLLTDDVEEGWASELRQYLGSMQRDVTKDTDLVEWWQVRELFLYNLIHLVMFSRTKHSCIQHSHVLHLMCFRPKHLLFHVSDSFRAVSKLRRTADRLWVL